MTIKAALVYDENSGEFVEADVDNDAIGDFGDLGSMLVVRDGGRLNAYALPGASQRLMYAIHRAARTWPDRGLSAYDGPGQVVLAVGRLLEME